MKKLFWVTLLSILMLNACTPISAPSPTETPFSKSTSTSAATSVLVEPTQTVLPTDVAGPHNKTCPIIYQEPDRKLNLRGNLLFGKGYWLDDNRFNTIYAMHFPDFAVTTFLAADEGMEYHAPMISPNGNLLAIIKSYNVEDYAAIEIYSANGDLLNSIPWNSDEWYGFRGWAGNSALVLDAAQDNTLIVLDPFSETTHNVDLGLTDDVRIRGFDPFVSVFALGYRNPIDSRSIDRTILWDANQKEALWPHDLPGTWIYEVKWSYDGMQIAMLKNRDELILLDNQGNLHQISSLSGGNILVWGIQWSLDDERIFFWGWDDDLTNSRIVDETYQDSGQHLYGLDLSNNQIIRYCFTSKSFNSPSSDNPTKIYSLPVSPNYFITENYTTYNSGNNIYKYDVLLVDSQNNKAYKLGEQFDMIGWMPDIP